MVTVRHAFANCGRFIQPVGACSERITTGVETAGGDRYSGTICLSSSRIAA